MVALGGTAFWRLFRRWPRVCFRLILKQIALMAEVTECEKLSSVVCDKRYILACLISACLPMLFPRVTRLQVAMWEMSFATVAPFQQVQNA